MGERNIERPSHMRNVIHVNFHYIYMYTEYIEKGLHMAMPASVLENIVSISDFSRGGASRAFEKAQGSTPVIVMKNNKPTAVITSPEEYAYLSEVEENFILLSESIIRLARNDDQPTTPLKDVLSLFDIDESELDALDDVELG